MIFKWFLKHFTDAIFTFAGKARIRESFLREKNNDKNQTNFEI